MPAYFDSAMRHSSVAMSTTPIKDGFGSMPQSPLSIGEIHQQLESEQEAQVNRLLLLIKDQQDQISALQTGDKPNDAQRIMSPTSPLANDTSPAHFRSGTNALFGMNGRRPSVVAYATRPKRPSFTRTTSAQSYTSSHHSAVGSPLIRPRSGQDNDVQCQPRALDETTFNSVETATLQKENQMLRNRIRELERQLRSYESATEE